MKRLKLLRHSYSSKLHNYWSSLSFAKQRVLLLAVFTLYVLMSLFVLKVSFDGNNSFITESTYQTRLKPINYLLDKEKDKLISNYLNQDYEK